MPISSFAYPFFAGLSDIDRHILEIKTKEEKPRYPRERKLGFRWVEGCGWGLLQQKTTLMGTTQNPSPLPLACASSASPSAHRHSPTPRRGFLLPLPRQRNRDPERWPHHNPQLAFTKDKRICQARQDYLTCLLYSVETMRGQFSFCRHDVEVHRCQRKTVWFRRTSDSILDTHLPKDCLAGQRQGQSASSDSEFRALSCYPSAWILTLRLTAPLVGRAPHH